VQTTRRVVNVKDHTANASAVHICWLEDRHHTPLLIPQRRSLITATMVLIRFASALAAASVLLTAAAQDTPSKVTHATDITTPTVTMAARAQVSIGCFATATPMELYGTYDFQSPGNCQLVCIEQKKNVFAVSDGINCYCGDKIPAKDWQTDNSTCDTNCAGDKTVKCTRHAPSSLLALLT
jgi:cell wall integrity and stress response component